jgi:hypothetical protein
MPTTSVTPASRSVVTRWSRAMVSRLAWLTIAPVPSPPSPNLGEVSALLVRGSGCVHPWPPGRAGGQSAWGCALLRLCGWFAPGAGRSSLPSGCPGHRRAPVKVVLAASCAEPPCAEPPTASPQAEGFGRPPTRSPPGRPFCASNWSTDPGSPRSRQDGRHNSAELCAILSAC